MIIVILLFFTFDYLMYLAFKPHSKSFWVVKKPEVPHPSEFRYFPSFCDINLSAQPLSFLPSPPNSIEKVIFFQSGYHILTFKEILLMSCQDTFQSKKNPPKMIHPGVSNYKWENWGPERSHGKHTLRKLETPKDKIVTFSHLYLAWIKIASLIDWNKVRR